MADFNQAIALTLQHEGGYVNNPADSGGPTKYGITEADMPGVNIVDITSEQATAYYKVHYWKDLYSQIDSQIVCNKLFDMGVLAGVGTAVKCLQRTLTLRYATIAIDGVFGPTTLGVLNQDAQGLDEKLFLQDYEHFLNTHFEAVVASSPKDAVFLKGWEVRVAS